MISTNLVLCHRSVAGGHVIEIDFELNDKRIETLQIPFAQIPRLLREIWDAAAHAETTQRQAAGEQMIAVVAPYRATAVRTGSSRDETILLDFSTAQGPMQIAMASDLARSTIEQLSAVLSAPPQFPRPS